MLLSRTLRYLPAQLIGPLAQFAAVVIWTHLLPPAAYGTVALVLALQELVSQICLGWWSSYMLRYAAAVGEDARERQGAHENVVLLGSSALQIGLALAVLALGDTALTPDLVAAALAYTVSRGLMTHMAERARAAGAILTYTVAQTAGPVLGLVLAIALVKAVPTASAALAGFAVAQIAILPFLWWKVVPSRALAFDGSSLRRAVVFSAPLVAGSAVGWAVVNGIRVIVEHVDGAAAVGLLSVGWGLGQRLTSVAAMLVTAAAFPIAVERMVRSGPEAAYAQVGRNGVLLLAILMPATAGIVCLTPALVDLLIGPEFREATRVLLPVATLAAAVRNLRVHFIDQVFLLCERPRVLLEITLVEAVVTLGGCWFGLVQGGLLGACLGCLAGSVVGFLVCGWRAYREGLRLPLLPVCKVGLATGAMVAALVLAPAFPGKLGLAGTVAGAAGLYFAVMGLLFRDAWPLRRQPA